MRRTLSALASFALLIGALGATPAAAGRTAIVLHGLDNTLSTVDLDTGTETLGEATFPGFTSEGLLRNGLLYVVVSGADRVFVLDPVSFTPVDTLETGPGSNPYALDVDAAGNVYVSLLNAGELVRYDATGAETGRVPVGLSPEDVLLAGGKLFVADSGLDYSDFTYDPGTLSVLDPATLAPLGTVPVGINPQWMVEVGGEVHTVCTGDYFSVFGEAHVVDVASLAPADTVLLGGSPGSVAAAGGVVYTTDYFGGVFAYDAATGQVLHDTGNAIHVGGTGYSGVAADGAGGLLVSLFADDLLVRIDLATGTLDAAYPTGDGPGFVVVREDPAVPVRLLSFDLARVEDGVAVSWALSGAGDAAGILVERRPEGGMGWTEVAKRFPETTGSVLDRAAPREALTYRLRARLRTGEIQVLAERTTASGPGEGLSLRPLANPARGTLLLGVEGAPRTGTATLHDVSGRRVAAGSWSGGSGIVRFDLTAIPAGVYFIRASSEGRTAAARVVVAP